MDPARDANCVETLPAERTKRSRDQLIPMLQEIQTKDGFLSQEAMSTLAAALARNQRLKAMESEFQERIACAKSSWSSATSTSKRVRSAGTRSAE